VWSEKGTQKVEGTKWLLKQSGFAPLKQHKWFKCSQSPPCQVTPESPLDLYSCGRFSFHPPGMSHGSWYSRR